MDDSEDESYDEMDCSQQLNSMESYKIIEQENQNLLPMGLMSSSTRVSVKHNGTTSTSTFLQCLFTQYLCEAVITILYLQPSLTVSVHGAILHHLYEGISRVVQLLSSLLAPLRSEILRSSLLTSLRNKFLRLSPLASLRRKFLFASPLV